MKIFKPPYSLSTLMLVAFACLLVGGLLGVLLDFKTVSNISERFGKARKKLKNCRVRNKNLQELRSSKTNDMNWTNVHINEILQKTDSILNSLPVCDTAAIDAVRDLAKQNAEFQRRKLTGCLPTKFNCKYPVNVMECRVEIFHNDRSNEYLICRIVKKGK